jgi:hypothetical protein
MRTDLPPVPAADGRLWMWSLLLFLGSMVFFAVSLGARYGDSPVYSTSIVAGTIIEPGHLLWTPLGALISKAAGLATSVSHSLYVLQFLSLICSGLTVLITFHVLCRLTTRTVALLLASIVGATNGFWAYSASGTSYSCCTMFIAMSLAASITRNEGAELTEPRSFLAGAYAGLAMSSWGPAFLAIPGLWIPAAFRTFSLRRSEVMRCLRRTLLYSFGCLLTGLLPLVAVYVASRAIPGNYFQSPVNGSFLDWIGSSSHGISGDFGVGQILRFGIGFAQSLVSVGTLNEQLRLWFYGETSLPVRPELLLVGAIWIFFAWLAMLAVKRLWAEPGSQRVALVAAIGAIAPTMLFGLYWQPTDLERYFPCLLFIALTIAIVLNRPSSSNRQTVAILTIVLLGMIAINGLLNIAASLSPQSFRSQWVSGIRAQAMNKSDLIFLMGNRKAAVIDPHNPDFPEITLVSLDVPIYGAQWKSLYTDLICKTVESGGRIFVGDSVLWKTTAPRDGWSFREHPEPTPVELSTYFSQFAGSSPMFAVEGEQVWNNKPDLGLALRESGFCS